MEEDDIIIEHFPDEQVLAVHAIDYINVRPQFADIANYIVTGDLPIDLSFKARKKFLHDVCYFMWEDPFLYKMSSDNVIR